MLAQVISAGDNGIGLYQHIGTEAARGIGLDEVPRVVDLVSLRILDNLRQIGGVHFGVLQEAKRADVCGGDALTLQGNSVFFCGHKVYLLSLFFQKRCVFCYF